MSGLLWLCFALSGAAALALEVLWMRSAGLVLGTTATTAATVLACYFAGLGVGATCARRGSPRPVRLYGCLELGAGASALWSLAVFLLLTHDAAQSWLATVGMVGRVAAVAVAILPTTLCLGATLPALGQALASIETVGRRGGLLYAVNTLGGVLGAATAGFGLPALVGVRASYGIAAGASLLAGSVAIAVGDRYQKAHITNPNAGGTASPAQRRRLPNNRTGDPLLISSPSFWNPYATPSERVTVTDVLAAEARMQLERRGFSVVSAEAVEAAIGSHTPGSPEEAADLAARGKLEGNALYLEIKRWEMDMPLHPKRVLVALEASLIDVATGRIMWTAHYPLRPVPTPGAVTRWAADMIAAHEVAEEMLAPWGPERPAS